MGWNLGTEAVAAAFASWPAVVQFLTKFVVSMPFTFHSLNGVRHLVWDATYMMTNKQVNWTGWTVVGLSVTSAFALALV